MLTILGLTEKELSILLVDNTEIKELNQRYRQLASATDVLAFPIADELVPHLLGDVVISVAQAQIQAVEEGHSLKKELTILLAHGILHLLGYTDYNEDETAIMFQRQQQLVQQITTQQEKTST